MHKQNKGFSMMEMLVSLVISTGIMFLSFNVLETNQLGKNRHSKSMDAMVFFSTFQYELFNKEKCSNALANQTLPELGEEAIEFSFNSQRGNFEAGYNIGGSSKLIIESLQISRSADLSELSDGISSLVKIHFQLKKKVKDKYISIEKEFYRAVELDETMSPQAIISCSGNNDVIVSGCAVGVENSGSGTNCYFPSLLIDHTGTLPIPTGNALVASGDFITDDQLIFSRDLASETQSPIKVTKSGVEKEVCLENGLGCPGGTGGTSPADGTNFDYEYYSQRCEKITTHSMSSAIYALIDNGEWDRASANYNNAGHASDINYDSSEPGFVDGPCGFKVYCPQGKFLVGHGFKSFTSNPNASLSSNALNQYKTIEVTENSMALYVPKCLEARANLGLNAMGSMFSQYMEGVCCHLY